MSRLVQQDNLVYCTWAQRATFPERLKRQFGDLDEYIRQLVASCKTSLTMVSPYLSPRWMDAFRASLAVSASRGAFIRLLSRQLTEAAAVNSVAARRLVDGDDGAIIRNRIRFLEASPELSDFVHAKVIIGDRERGYIGSANFSERAMGSNFEIASALLPRQCEALDDLIDYLESMGLLNDRTNEVVDRL